MPLSFVDFLYEFGSMFWWNMSMLFACRILQIRGRSIAMRSSRSYLRERIRLGSWKLGNCSSATLSRLGNCWLRCLELWLRIDSPTYRAKLLWHFSFNPFGCYYVTLTFVESELFGLGLQLKKVFSWTCCKKHLGKYIRWFLTFYAVFWSSLLLFARSVSLYYQQVVRWIT